MSQVSEKIAEKGLEFLDTAIKVAQNEAPKLTSQFLDYMAFDCLLGLARTLLWAAAIYSGARVISAWIKAYSDTMVEVDAKKNPNTEDYRSYLKASDAISFLKPLRLFVTVVGTLFLLMSGIPEVRTLGKIIIAPQVYLIQEGAQLYKGMQK